MRASDQYQIIITHNDLRYVMNVHHYPPNKLNTPRYTAYFDGGIEVGAEAHSFEELMENFFRRWEDYNECGP